MKKVLICGGGKAISKEKGRGINIVNFDNEEVKQRLANEAMNITELQEYTPPQTRKERRAEERMLKKQKH